MCLGPVRSFFVLFLCESLHFVFSSINVWWFGGQVSDMFSFSSVWATCGNPPDLPRPAIYTPIHPLPAWGIPLDWGQLFKTCLCLPLKYHSNIVIILSDPSSFQKWKPLPTKDAINDHKYQPLYGGLDQDGKFLSDAPQHFPELLWEVSRFPIMYIRFGYYYVGKNCQLYYL